MDTNDLRIKVFEYSMDHFTAQGTIAKFLAQVGNSFIGN